MRVLAVCGSLRAVSSNAALIEAARRLAPPDLEVLVYDGLGALPLFNPDFDDDPPPNAKAWRDQVGAVDGLLICSPEYARGVAGAMKNALDWLVGSLDFAGKPVALLNASQRSVHSDGQLRLILETMAARLIEPASVTIPLMGRGLDAAGIIADGQLSGEIRRALDAFALAIAARE